MGRGISKIRTLRCVETGPWILLQNLSIVMFLFVYWRGSFSISYCLVSDVGSTIKLSFANSTEWISHSIVHSRWIIWTFTFFITNTVFSSKERINFVIPSLHKWMFLCHRMRYYLPMALPYFNENQILKCVLVCFFQSQISFSCKCCQIFVHRIESLSAYLRSWYFWGYPSVV